MQGIQLPSFRAILVLAVIAGGGACAGAAKQGAEAQESRPQSNSSDISRDQILKGNYQNAYDAVKALHPNWLLRRSPVGTNSVSAVIVFLDGTRYGDADRLQNIPGLSVGNIKHFDSAAATMRWGTGYSEGVVYVTSVER